MEEVFAPPQSPLETPFPPCSTADLRELGLITPQGRAVFPPPMGLPRHLPGPEAGDRVVIGPGPDSFSPAGSLSSASESPLASRAMRDDMIRQIQEGVAVDSLDELWMMMQYDGPDAFDPELM